MVYILFSVAYSTRGTFVIFTKTDCLVWKVCLTHTFNWKRKNHEIFCASLFLKNIFCHSDVSNMFFFRLKLVQNFGDVFYNHMKKKNCTFILAVKKLWTKTINKLKISNELKNSVLIIPTHLTKASHSALSTKQTWDAPGQPECQNHL